MGRLQFQSQGNQSNSNVDKIKVSGEETMPSQEVTSVKDALVSSRGAHDSRTTNYINYGNMIVPRHDQAPQNSKANLSQGALNQDLAAIRTVAHTESNEI